jgi:hypothetical protein
MACDPNSCDKKCQDHGAISSEVSHIKEDIDELKDYNNKNDDIKGRVQILETRSATIGMIVGTSVLILIALFSSMYAAQMTLQGKIENLTAKVYELVMDRVNK